MTNVIILLCSLAIAWVTPVYRNLKGNDSITEEQQVSQIHPQGADAIDIPVYFHSPEKLEVTQQETDNESTNDSKRQEITVKGGNAGDGISRKGGDAGSGNVSAKGGINHVSRNPRASSQKSEPNSTNEKSGNVSNDRGSEDGDDRHDFNDELVQDDGPPDSSKSVSSETGEGVDSNSDSENKGSGQTDDTSNSKESGSEDPESTPMGEDTDSDSESDSREGDSESDSREGDSKRGSSESTPNSNKSNGDNSGNSVNPEIPNDSESGENDSDSRTKSEAEDNQSAQSAEITK